MAQKIWRNSFDMFDLRSRISMTGYVRRTIFNLFQRFFFRFGWGLIINQESHQMKCLRPFLTHELIPRIFRRG